MKPEIIRVSFPQPSDGHVHLRWDKRFFIALLHTATHFARAGCMGNTKPPITTAELIVKYREYIDVQAAIMGFHQFEPLLILYITDETTPEDLAQAQEVGAIGCKWIPRGRTTGSEFGVTNFRNKSHLFRAAQELNFPCLLHGTLPHDPDKMSNPMLEEAEFFPTLTWMFKTFPDLRIVYEHVSSKDVAEFIVVANEPRLAATITVHHLYTHLGDVISPKLRPHNFCMPIPKAPEDMTYLRSLALSGNPRFFLGTDSAPHFREKKECDGGDAGVFSAPVAISMLLDLFCDENGWKRDHKEPFVAFTSGNFADYYGLPEITEMATYEREPWITPAEYDGIVPFYANQPQNWQLAA